MNTLILNGSPHPDGDTGYLIAQLRKRLQGEVTCLSVYTADIAPCVDCRACREVSGCVIADGMQAVYAALETVDNLVVASPLYFSELTGPLLELGSRLQTYFSARRFRSETPPLSVKRGGVLLVGGGMGRPEKAYETAVCLLRYMGAAEMHPLVGSFRTDSLPAWEDAAVLPEIERLADFLNRLA